MNERTTTIEQEIVRGRERANAGRNEGTSKATRKRGNQGTRERRNMGTGELEN